MDFQNTVSIMTIDNILDTGVINKSIDNILDTSVINKSIEDRRLESINDEYDKEFPSIIYRYKFAEEFMEQLYVFSKIHQYDDRKDFKEAWKNWTEENDEIIDIEMRRLLNLGYDGDILNKMFKSARYYFRKKSGEKKEPKQRRQYISVNRELLDAMDNHISKKIFDAEYQPKTGFIEFCKDNEKILKETIAKIFEQGIKSSELIEDKIKKTYKNRYFMLTNKEINK